MPSSFKPVQGITGDTGERRIVTVLFADLVSSTKFTLSLETEDAQTLLDHAMAVMANAIRQYGGFVIRYQGDGVMASFGAPQSAEDHALRACFAGLAIQQAFRSSNDLLDNNGEGLKVRIGIHSGLVITRNLESDVGGGLDVAGPSVSLAAFAEKVCPIGAVTATSATADLAGLHITTQPIEVPDSKIPGVDFVQVLDASLEPAEVDAGQQSVLVGRETEQSTLRRFLQGLDRGGCVCAILGEAGIGKSRLARWFATEASKQQMPVYVVSAFSITSATPYLPLRQFFHELLELNRDATQESIFEAVSQLELAAAVRDQLAVFLTGTQIGDIRLIDNEKAAVSLLPGLLARVILQILGTTRTLVIFEDLHFLDTESIYCLKQVAKRAGSLTNTVFVFTARPEAASHINRLRADMIHLAPLQVDAVREFISMLDTTGYITEDAELELVERSGGIPLVLEQLVRTLSDSSDNVVLRELPGKVESLVSTRLYQLSKRAKTIAQKLSVLEDEFEVTLAARFLDEDKFLIKEVFLELEIAGFLETVSSNLFRYKHSIIRESCLNSLIRSERSILHAKALQAFDENSSPPLYERLAYHAEQSNQDEVALKYLWEACKESARQSAVHSLSILYERAIACCERIGVKAEPSEVDIVLLAFDAMQQHGKIQSVIPRLPRAAELAKKHKIFDKQCLALTHLSTVLWFQADYQEGRKLAKEAVSLARSSGSLPALFYSQFSLANLLHGCGEVHDATMELVSITKLLTNELEMVHLGSIGLPSVMCRSFLGWYQIELGEYDAARNHIEQACNIASRANKPYTTVIAHVPKGRLLLETGEYSDACAVLLPLRELCLKHRIYAMEPVVTGLLAGALIKSGDNQHALKITGYSIENQFYKSAARYSWYFLFSSHAVALAGTGKVIEAINSLERTVSANEIPRDPPNLAQSLVTLGFVLLDSGNDVEAANAFNRAIHIANECGMFPTVIRGHLGLSSCTHKSMEAQAKHRDIALEISRKLCIDFDPSLNALRFA